MNRTSWPVLRRIRNLIQFSVFLFLITLTFSFVHAEEQPMTSSQGAEPAIKENLSYTIRIHSPKKVKLNEKFTIEVIASNKANSDVIDPINLDLQLNISTSKETTSKNIRLRQGKAVIEFSFDRLGVRTFTTRNLKDANDIAYWGTGFVEVKP